MQTDITFTIHDSSIYIPRMNKKDVNAITYITMIRQSAHRIM
jgi:hypothetical protein